MTANEGHAKSPSAQAAAASASSSINTDRCQATCQSTSTSSNSNSRHARAFVDHPPSLSSLPPEILEHIAFTLAQLSPYDPPSDVLSLASCSSLMRASLLPSYNQRLWAKLFKVRFDSDAIVRRLASSKQHLKASLWADAFVERTQALTRIRHSGQDPDGVSLQELWLAFLMLLEHDEKNVEQLRRHARLPRYLEAYYRDKLLGDAMQPGYPQETPERTLVLHMQYLLTSREQLKDESQHQAAERFFVLKPYVFAAHHYTAYFAPWTAKVISFNPADNETSDVFGPIGGPLDRLPERLHSMSYFGQTLTLRPPPLFQAACLSFSMRADNDAEVAGQFSGAPEIINMPSNLSGLSSSASAMPRRRQSMGASARAASASSNSFTQSLTLRLSSRLETPLATLASRAHDFGFHRLQTCASPSSHPGLDLSELRGQFAGVWEGRFTFFDFDSYREMLGGRVRSLYEGPLRAQPQIWRIEEHVVEVTEGMPEGGKGSALNAGFSRTLDEDRADMADAMKRAIPSTQPLDPQKKYEILLFGVGHSAWGSFVLRGRVRTWDGLFSLAKEYTPDGRGRWLYRGYACNDRDVLVGRWRDTFTPVDINGYEGTFVMQRRNLQEPSSPAQQA